MQSFKKTLGHENLFKKSYGVKMAQAQVFIKINWVMELIVAVGTKL